MKLEICEMTAKTANDAAAIEKECFSSPWPAESFLKILSNKSAACFVARMNSRTVGYISMYDLVDEVSIINVAAHPDFRRQGIAKALMLRAEEFAETRACKQITLEVRRSNAAAAFFVVKSKMSEKDRDKNTKQKGVSASENVCNSLQKGGGFRSNKRY